MSSDPTRTADQRETPPTAPDTHSSRGYSMVSVSNGYVGIVELYSYHADTASDWRDVVWGWSDYHEHTYPSHRHTSHAPLNDHARAERIMRGVGTISNDKRLAGFLTIG